MFSRPDVYTAILCGYCILLKRNMFIFDVKDSAGYTAGFTARHNWDYIPVPALLPLASVGYGALDFQMTYIPGTHNNGNVYFAWLRYHF